ncbi:MAG: septal ring lytic transglycosylase RlpA family protein [Pseudomonadota bacterium]
MATCMAAAACSGQGDPLAPNSGAGNSASTAGEVFEETGLASWYGERYHGRTTASGETFDMHAMTAAHKALPFGSVVRVTDLSNGRSVVVTINDRGPFVPGRIIDLSRKAAQKLGFLDDGVTQVGIKVIN